MDEAVQIDVMEKNSGVAQGCLVIISGQALLQDVPLLVNSLCF